MLPINNTFGPANLSSGVYLGFGVGWSYGGVGLGVGGAILGWYGLEMGGLSICN